MKEISFKIGNRIVGPGHPVLVVAEMSANHNQDFERAKNLVKAACEVGAGAIKLQTYTPDTLTIDSRKEWFVVNIDNPWKGRNLYELYSKAYMPWEWQPELKKIADSYGVPLFSTAYDDTAVDFLEKMDVPAYKIASFEVIDIGLLKKVGATKKPVIISRGMSNLSELATAIRILRENGAPAIAVLHCVSAYPAKPEQMNLATIPAIREILGVVSGLSDHTLGLTIPILSVAFGASIIEKHFTFKKADGGVDSSFSLEAEEFKELVQSVKEAEKAIGHIQLDPEPVEVEIAGRRSLYAIRDIKKRERFSSENVRSLRIAKGLKPEFLPLILGRKATKNLERGTPLAWDMVGEN